MEVPMKKLIFLFIIILNISSYSIKIKIIKEDRTPLKEVFVNINNQVKVSNSKGNVTFDILDEVLNISISKEGYIKKNFTLKNSINGLINFTLVMKSINTSYITFEFPINDGLIEYREIGTNKYIKVPFSENLKSIEFLQGTYEFIFSTKSSIKNKQILNFNNKSEHIFIDIKFPKNNFFIIGNASKNKEINFFKDNISKISPLKNTNLVIFQNGKIKKKIKLKNTFVPIKLKDGIYDFMIENEFYPNLYFKNLKLNSTVNKNIVISIPNIEVAIKGVIKNNDQFVGGAKISFTDVDNNSYETTTTFGGHFFLNLPPKKYKISLKKPGFLLKNNQNLIYDFTTPKEVYKLNLETEEVLSNIKGIITDDKGIAIQNANIIINNSSKIIHLKSDDFGNFSTPILPGLLFIKVEKKGYKAFGIVIKLERFSNLSGLNISLTPYLSNISGIISNNFTPLSNLNLTLRNLQGEAVANTVSNQNGYYEFSDIKINENYFISIGTQTYQYYYSDVFILTKDDIVNKNIILQSRKIRIHLELLKNSNTPLNNENIIIEGVSYKTDSNGFLLLDLPEDTESINIYIKSYGYQKKINLNSISKNPNQLTLIIK